LNGDFYKDRDTKIVFLTKIIQLVEMMTGAGIEAKPQKIVAGLEPENTNVMLQILHKCATSGKSSDPYVNKILGNGGAD
jgi:TRAF3-interacting protein 1